MIRVAALAVALLAASPALARPDARTMTCAGLNQLIAREGAIVLTTGDFTYERFVASPRFCMERQMMKPVYQLTVDERQCVVHSICGDRAFDFEDTFD